jgi:hypothetical protein
VPPQNIADVRGRQVDQHTRIAFHAEAAAQAHALRLDIAVREQRGLRQAGRAGGVDDLAAVGFAHGGVGGDVLFQPRHFRIGQRFLRFGFRFSREGEGGQRAVNRLARRRELHEVLDERAILFHRLPERAEISQRRLAEKRIALRLDQPERANDLRPLEPQIERRVNHADLAAGVFEKNVLGQKRQAGGEEVALRETQPQQLQRQRGARLIELLERVLFAGVGKDERDRVGLFARPFFDHPVDEMAVGEVFFEVLQRVLRNAVAMAKFGHGRAPWSRQRMSVSIRDRHSTTGPEWRQDTRFV